MVYPGLVFSEGRGAGRAGSLHDFQWEDVSRGLQRASGSGPPAAGVVDSELAGAGAGGVHRRCGVLQQPGIWRRRRGDTGRFAERLDRGVDRRLSDRRGCSDPKAAVDQARPCRAASDQLVHVGLPGQRVADVHQWRCDRWWRGPGGRVGITGQVGQPWFGDLDHRGGDFSGCDPAVWRLQGAGASFDRAGVRVHLDHDSLHRSVAVDRVCGDLGRHPEWAGISHFPRQPDDWPGRFDHRDDRVGGVRGDGDRSLRDDHLHLLVRGKGLREERWGVCSG